MSKIPVPKSGFNSWLSTNEGKPSKSVLYEQKYQDHHDRIRNKENMSENGGKSSSNFVSMVNPRPTPEDYEKYDADRRLREKARDMRVAKRSESNSSRNSLSRTPESKETSPANDQYFTPQRRSSSGLDDEFVTPSTSKKDKRKERRTPGSSDVTPVSTKPPRSRTIEQQLSYTTCLSRKMEENFSRMQNLVVSGQSMQEARQQNITESTIREASYADRSPRRFSRRTISDDILVNRSSSQPPPIDTLNMFPGVSRPKTPPLFSSTVNKTSMSQASYVDTLVAAHQMHIQYADKVVVGVENQMTKLESIKNLAALSKSPASEEANLRRKAAEALRKLAETNEQRTKKLEVIRGLKDQIEKITNVQKSCHYLVTSKPFKGDEESRRLLRSLDGWISLPFHEFDVQTAREIQYLHRKMMNLMIRFKNIASLHRKDDTPNRSFSTGRKSSAMKIEPTKAPPLTLPTDFSQLDANTREAATQVSARLAEAAMTQTSPRLVGVEPLDFSSLEVTNASSQTTPTISDQAKSSIPIPVQTKSSLSITTPTSTVADINDMLNSIVLHNESLETIDSFSHFKSDISYPSFTPALSEQSTPRSGRVSLDSESARRLSAGVSHYLEKIKKENESFERKHEEDGCQEDQVSLPPVTKIQEAPVVTEEKTDVAYENQTPPSQEESEVELNIEDHDETQFEHEMEEQEEQRRLRESVTTPTPPVVSDYYGANPEEYMRTTTLFDPDDEQDETKKFSTIDEFERSLEDENSNSGVGDMNNSADDSGFLLDDKPVPRLKSIFDNASTSPSSSGLQEDTPRVSTQADETTFVGMEMEEYCQKLLLSEMGPIMVKKAIEFQNELRGLDWISAQEVWKPPSLETVVDVNCEDDFEYFDSYWILIWGAVVDLINRKYLKFGRKMTTSEESKFEKEALDMLQNDYGPESKRKEWCREVKMSKKLEGMMPFDLDYRFDKRGSLADSEKQKYQWQQVQMVVIADRYPRRNMVEDLNEVYILEKEKLGQVVINGELDHIAALNENSHQNLENKTNDELISVSNV